MHCTFIEDVLSRKLLNSIGDCGVDLGQAIVAQDKKLPAILCGVFWGAVPQGPAISTEQAGSVKRERVQIAHVTFREIEAGLRGRQRSGRQVGRELIEAIRASEAGHTIGALIKEIRSIYLTRTNEVIQDFHNAAEAAKIVIEYAYNEPSARKFITHKELGVDGFAAVQGKARSAFLEYWARFENLEARHLDMEALSILLAISISAGYAILGGDEEKARHLCEFCQSVQDEYCHYFENNGEAAVATAIADVNRALLAPVGAFIGHLEQIISRSAETGVVTICMDSEEGVAFDVNPPEWEHDPECRTSVLETIALELSQTNAIVAVILRTQTPQIEPQYKVPIKEVRGYRLSTTSGGELQCFCLPQATLFNCCTTDAETGEPVPPEPDVLYVGDAEFSLS
jgi:hypothetical protein